MNEPSGEMVELDFYFGNRDRRKSLKTVFDFCIANGHVPTEEVLVNIISNRKNYKFKSIYDHKLTLIKDCDHNRIENLFVDEDIEIAKIGIWSVLGSGTKTPNIITYSGVSEEASASDSPAIAIVGEWPNPIVSGSDRQARNVGKLCYDVFLKLCSSANPLYSAILNEDSLPCKNDINKGKGKNSFLNFFVNRLAFGENNTSLIKNIYSKSYIENTDNGLYISTSKFFNPKNIMLNIDLSLSLSEEVSYMISLLNFKG